MSSTEISVRKYCHTQILQSKREFKPGIKFTISTAMLRQEREKQIINFEFLINIKNYLLKNHILLTSFQVGLTLEEKIYLDVTALIKSRLAKNKVTKHTFIC